MKLEINQTIVEEDVDGDDIKDALRVLSQEDEAFITLWESDEVYLQAAGVPQTGYVMSYHNAKTGEELSSKNQELKPMAVMRVLTSYARGNGEWRSSIAWEPMGSYAAKSVGLQPTWQRAWPLFVGVLFFTVAIVPLVMVTKYGVDQTVFKRLCEQYAPDFDHFEHGSGNGNINVGYSPGRCWYKDGLNITLQEIVGSGAVFIDTAGRIAQVVIPITVIVIIELTGFAWWFGRRKRVRN